MRKKSTITLAVVLIALACATIPGIRNYADRRSCVCSMLTATEETFTIEDRLYRVVEQDILNSGTFMIVRTTCNHDKQLHLTVYPDEGIFKGYIPKN